MTELLRSLALSFDLPILDWIQAHLQSGFLDTVMPIITLFGEGGIFWIAWKNYEIYQKMVALYDGCSFNGLDVWWLGSV